MFSKGGKSGDVNIRVTVEYFVYRGRSEYDVQRVVLHYLVGRWRLADLEVHWTAQPLDLRCQKCAYLRSNYRRSELETCVSCTKWLNILEQVWVDFSRVRVTSNFFELLRSTECPLRTQAGGRALVRTLPHRP
ncbi:hypothetical protein TNCV_4526211 [Trichonephila clavipes]|nr:hypothetical protein TNCV_4526211 [Trichonephila clavipes]